MIPIEQYEISYLGLNTMSDMDCHCAAWDDYFYTGTPAIFQLFPQDQLRKLAFIVKLSMEL